MPSDLPDRLLHLVRQEVRAEHAYHVGTQGSVEVKLNQNESPFDLPAALKRELLDAYVDIPFNRYPSEQPEKLMEAVARRESLPPGSVLVGNGSNELTYTLGLAYVEQGRTVVLPRPMFALYRTMVGLFGGQAAEVPPATADPAFDVTGILAAVETHRPVLTVLATPNNPGGRALPLADVEAVLKASQGMVLVDEAYVEFNPHGSAAPLLDRYNNLLILRTLSKSFGLAGLRIGFLLGHPAVIAELMKARLPFMIDRFAETAALACLDHTDLMIERVEAMKACKQQLQEGLSRIPDIEVLPSDTNFLLFRTPKHPGTLLSALAEEGVLIRNMGGYPELQGFLRVSAGTEAENTRFLDALKRQFSPTD